MKEQNVARIHFYILVLESIQNMVDAIRIGTGLIACQLMMDPAAMMGTSDDLQATIGTRCGVHSDESTDKIGSQNAVGVPIAIVLMPRPSATDTGVLHDHFRMVVIRFVA